MFNQNRRDLIRTTLAMWLLVVVLLPSGCRLLGQTEPDEAAIEAAIPTATSAPEAEASNAEVVLEPTAIPLEEPTATAEATAIVEPTVTEEATATTAPTEVLEPTSTSTPLLLPTATQTESLPTLVPTLVPVVAPTTAISDTVQPDAIQLEILVTTLRIREGPSTDFEILSVGKAGERFEISGRSAGCDWMQIRFGTDQVGWVSSNFVLYPGLCNQFAIVGDDTPLASTEVPATETSTTETPAAATPTAEPLAADTPTIEPPTPAAEDSPTPESAVSDTSPTTGEDLLPGDKGCYLFQVRLDDQVDVTFTRQDREWATTFTLEANEDQVYCLDPGKYAFRLVAPAPWDEYTDELEVNAGDRYLFPIRPLE